MKNILLLSGILLSIGLGATLFSFIPQPHREPYWRKTQQRVEKVQKDGTVSSWYTFYSQSFSCVAGDTISIRAQAQTSGESLSIVVSQTLGSTIEQREDVTDINITVTIPTSGSYTVTINRYRYSPFVVWLAPAEAYIYVKTNITETKLEQGYRTVLTYPYKELLAPGVVLMIAGIGFGIFTIAQQKTSQPKHLAQEPNTRISIVNRLGIGALVQ